MNGQPEPAVVGIDVGGERKGYHAVVLRGGKFLEKETHADPGAILKWCRNHEAAVVAVDAPCQWSQSDSSRLAERELKLLGKQIYCFSTPTRARALNREFYRWVFNGERLYGRLADYYSLFDGQWRVAQTCIETFPHAIVCAMAGRVICAKPKAKVRREALNRRGFDVSSLPNIDFVDAALCAIAADEFRNRNYQLYGNNREGFIVVPQPPASCES